MTEKINLENKFIIKIYTFEYNVKFSFWVSVPQSHSANQPTAPCGRAATRHQEYKQSDSTCSLFPIKMIAKLERTQSTAQQNMEQTQNPHNGSNNKEQINNNRTNALERTASELRVSLARRKTGLSPAVNHFTDRSKAVLLLWIFYVFFCLAFAMPLCLSVYMCLVVNCWERADLLAPVCGV